MVSKPCRLIVTAAAVVACSEQPSGPRPQLIDDAASAVVPPAPQRVRWRFKLDGDYSMHSPGVAADGTVYVNMENGKLFAVAPNGTLRWIVPIGSCGLPCGSVSVGADGTIYAAGVVPDPNGQGSTGAIFAITPAGSTKWVFNQTGQFIIAGPNIGPDGNIYAVADVSGTGLFSLTPQGQLRFSTGSFTDFGAHGTDIAFGSGQLYFAFDMAGISGPALFGYGLNGNFRFQVPDPANNARPAVGPNGNIVIQTFPGNIGLTLAAYTPAGALAWRFNQLGAANTMEHPDVGPDNVSYVVRNLSTLHALTANGIEQWRYRDTGIMFEPRVGPRNDLVFMGGRITYGAPGFFLAVATTGVPLWRVDLPDEPGFEPYGQLVPMTRPVFTPDGNTAYMVTDVAGDGNSSRPYSFLYSIDVSAGTGGTPNQNPVASFTYNCVARVPPPGFTCSFNGSPSSDPDGSVTAWSWTSPGKPTKSGVTTSYNYSSAGSYTVTLTVTDNNGATDSQTQTIGVGGTPPQNQNPVADFTMNCVPRSPNVGSDCTFNGSASRDPDGSIVSYAWSSPGKVNKLGVIATYAFPTGANTSVTLRVTDNLGATGSKTVSVVIP